MPDRIPTHKVRCVYTPPSCKIFTEGKTYPARCSPRGMNLTFTDDLGHERVMCRNSLEFCTRNDAPMGIMEFARFVLVEDPMEEARLWLDDMIDTLAEADPQPDWSWRELTVQLIEEYIRWHVSQSAFPADMARNAALKAINEAGGLVLFLSPDTDTRCLTTASHLQQMLQCSSVGEALDATAGVVVY